MKPDRITCATPSDLPSVGLDGGFVVLGPFSPPDLVVRFGAVAALELGQALVQMAELELDLAGTR